MIFFENMQDKINWSNEEEKFLESIINFALHEEGVTCDAEVSVLLVDNDEIRSINSQHRNIDKVTDVLSFPMLDYYDGKVFKEQYSGRNFDSSMMDGDELVLGDIVISLEKAEEQSKDYGHSFKRELSYLTIHSVLHLLGYDHMVEADKAKMRDREEKILLHFNISRE